jgi:vitamin B12 transporter
MLRRKLPAALLLGCPFVYASNDVSESAVITATRTAQSADDTLASVTVVTRAELERTQAASLQDALRGVAGLNLDNNGGLGKATSIFLRGAESDHVLVLIDGVKVGSATLGTVSFQDIPVDQIERIEIVRGPRSSLYGSEAIGGVIQIFTRRGRGGFAPEFSAGAGSRETYKLAAGVSGGDERTWGHVNLGTLRTAGFNACNGDPGGGGCFADEPDADGYRNHSVTLRGGHRFAGGMEIEATALRAQGHNEFDGTYVNESDYAQQALGAQLRFAPVSLWHAALLIGQSRDDSKSYFEDTFRSRFDTRRDAVSFQNDIAPTATQLVTVGIDYQKDSVTSTTDFDVSTRDNRGLFVQYQIALGAQSLQISARGDDNSQFDRHNTGGVLWGLDLAPGVRVKASYGTAFKAPTFNDLYYPGFGNPALKPETSRSGELGLEGKSAASNWSVAVYRTTTEDLIAFDSVTYAPANIAAARVVGAEFAFRATLADWALNANASLLHPENRSTDSNRGNVLPRRAEEIANVDVGRRIGAFGFGAALHAEGRRYDDLANNNKLAGYATLDVRGDYTFARAWMLQARVANLFDKQYETARYFNQDGRSYFLTVRYQHQAN